MESGTAVQMKKANTDELKIVLLGLSGVEKSAVGNIILGKKAFGSEVSYCEVKENINNRIISVIDTPGIFDTRFNSEIEKMLAMSLFTPGHYAILIVINSSRFTKKDEEIIDRIRKIFGEGSLQNTMVLFSDGDWLNKNNMDIDEFINENPDLMSFIQATSKQYHVFDNSKKDRMQVTILLDQIEQLVTGQQSQNEMLPKAHLAIPEKKPAKQQAKKKDGNNALLISEIILAVVGVVFVAVLWKIK